MSTFRSWRNQTLGLVLDRTVTVGFIQSDKTQWPVEELIAMEFAYIKQLAKHVAGKRVVIYSIEIAGLKTLALISDDTEVVLNHALTRSTDILKVRVLQDL